MLVTDRIPPLRVDGRTVHQVGPPLPLGQRGLATRRLRQRPAAPSRSTRTCTSRSRRPRPATCAPGRRPRGPALRALVEDVPRAGRIGEHGRERATTPTATRRASASGSSPTRPCASAARRARSRARSGTACPTTPLGFTGRVLRQHRRAGRQPLAPRGVHRAATGPTQPATAEAGLRWLMSRDVCKHCTEAACLDVVPDRRAVPHRVRHRRRAGGRVQRLRLLRGGVPLRRARPARGRRARLEVHALLRPAARTARSPPARRRARPTRSSSARSTSCASAPSSGSSACRRAAWTTPACTAHDPDDGVGGARRLLPAARRARGVRAAAGPGRHHARPPRHLAAGGVAAGALVAGDARRSLGGRR